MADPFTDYPLDTAASNATTMLNDHPDRHNAVAGAANELQETIDALQAALPGTYVPLDGGRSATLLPTDFGINGGAAAVSFINFWQPCLLFDAATDESGVASFIPPAGATTATVRFFWRNAGAGVGDVVWSVGIISNPDPLTFDQFVTLAPVTAGTDEQELVTVALTDVPVSDDQSWVFVIKREGDDVLDTLPNDVAFAAAEIRFGS